MMRLASMLRKSGAKGLADSGDVFDQIRVVNLMQERQVYLPGKHQVIERGDEAQAVAVGHLRRIQRNVDIRAGTVIAFRA